jgi:hypothetical protein
LGPTSQKFVKQTLWHQNFKWSLLFVRQLKKKKKNLYLSLILSKSTLVAARQLLLWMVLLQICIP